jgi:hypothetical protein
MSLTSDRNTPWQEAELVPVPVAAATKIYAGSLVCANAAGYAVPGSVSPTLTYLGRAERMVDNSAGANGALTVIVRRKKAFLWTNCAVDTITQASVGLPCYVYDDGTVAATSANNARSLAGIVLSIESDGVWVDDLPNDHTLYAAATLDYPSIAAGASADLTIALPGAALGDTVALGLPAAPAAGLLFMAFVSAANTVTVRAMNITAAAVDAASASYAVSI